MQFERNNVVGNLHERSRLFARIPPHIDLTVTTSAETENRWKSSSLTNNKNISNGVGSGSNFNKPLHVKTTNIENTTVKMGTDLLPIDPRDWTRQEVKKWILNIGRNEGINVEHIADKFKMNGKALCLMSVEMFMTRFPAGGKMLYRDFRLRLTKALSM